MMKLKFTFLFLVATIAMTACKSAAPPIAVKNPQNSMTAPAGSAPARPEQAHADDGHDAPRISLADAKKDFDAKTAVFIDTHSPEQYAERHIPGSINVPANNIEPFVNKIPKGKKIIAYCS
jgi:hypothetical protein